MYNILGNPIFFPARSVQIQDPKLLSYNFSMAAPIYVTGNFSVVISLDKPVSYYTISARANASVDYESYGAYAAFQLVGAVAENGFYHSPNKSEISFVIAPPIPETGYGAALNGMLPDQTAHEAFNHLVQGTNTLFFNFTFFSTGINGTTYTPPRYGSGYFKLNMGPFIVSITDLTVVYSLDAISELLLGGLLVPVAYGIGILFGKCQRSS